MRQAEITTLLERYQRLIELSRDLASTLDLKELLNRIVHAAADLSDSEAASILLYDEANQQLYFQATTNLDSPMMRGLVVPVESSIAGWIVQNRKPVIVSDAQKDPRHFSQVGKVTQVVTNSLLGVPLITKDKIIGVLEAINKYQGNFTEKDQDLLMALGAQAAVAIENSRLFQQSDLISELVHEIRTPLASLSAATHLLKRKNLDESLHDSILETIDQEIHRLSEMTTSYLDLARLESGRAQFAYEPVKITELLYECTVVTSSKFEEKNLELIISFSEDLPLIHADYDKIKQVVLNLLSNSVKYTSEGGTVRISAEASADDIICQIKDNGRGIPPESLPHLFEKFYRVPGSERTASGTGLGLSICQHIIEAHKGRIEIQSEVGIGSTVSVFLPIQRDNP